MMLIDSHTHLDDDRLMADHRACIARAHEAGVQGMLTIATRMAHVPRLRQLVEDYRRHPEVPVGVWYSVGVHPCEVMPAQNSDLRRSLVEAAQAPYAIGLGETGLDGYHDPSQLPEQEQAWWHHIEASWETGLPMIIHTREAEARTLEILIEAARHRELSGVIHCFSGSASFATSCLDLGLYLSCSGVVTFKNAHHLQDIMRQVPEDRLLVETDAPYLAPVPHRGARNEPAFVAHTAAYLAQLRGVTLPHLAQATTRNFFRLFSKAQNRTEP